MLLAEIPSTLRRAVIASAAVLGIVAAPATLSAQVWLIDFGSTNSFRGGSQVGTDDNGNTWNSLVPYWYVGNLTTANGASSGIAYSPPSSIGVDSYNGPLGTNVSNPLSEAQVDSVVIDSAALGVLGGSQAAAADFMSSTNGTFQIEGVNTQLTYDATFFGSYRWANEDTVIRRYFDTSYTSELGSVSLDVGGGGSYNSNAVASLTGFTATTNKLFFQWGTASGTNTGYLNSMALYGYLGYFSGGTTNLNSASPYIANGTYTNGDSRSVDTVIGGSTTINVGNASGIYYNSTVVITNGGGTIGRGTNFTIYALTGAGNLTLTGTNGLTISKGGDYSGTLTMTQGTLTLNGNGGLGTGGLVLNGGSLVINAAQGLGTGAITVASGTTTLNNPSALTALTGNNNFVLSGNSATFQVWGNGQVLNLGTGNVSVTGFNNLNGFSGGMQFNGAISGSGTLNWYGSGSLVLGGANTFSGTINAGANGGSLLLSNVNAMQAATLNKGTNHNIVFALAGSNTYNLGGLTGAGNIVLSNGNSLNVNSSSSSTYSGSLSDSGSLTKSGNGTLTLSGDNTFTGSVTLAGGTLAAAGAESSQTLKSITSLTVAGGATLLLAAGDQVSDAALITLSGGTIRRAPGVSEVFGDLNLTANSTLDFGSGTAGHLTFGTYEADGAPTASLTLANFFSGNTLILGSNLSAYLTPGTYHTNSFSNSYFTINSISGGFTASIDGSNFTITAIPEPQAVLAAAAMLAWFASSALRRMPGLR